VYLLVPVVVVLLFTLRTPTVDCLGPVPNQIHDQAENNRANRLWSSNFGDHILHDRRCTNPAPAGIPALPLPGSNFAAGSITPPIGPQLYGV
jgi:hypothetical protein